MWISQKLNSQIEKFWYESVITVIDTYCLLIYYNVDLIRASMVHIFLYLYNTNNIHCFNDKKH